MSKLKIDDRKIEEINSRLLSLEESLNTDGYSYNSIFSQSRADSVVATLEIFSKLTQIMFALESVIQNTHIFLSETIEGFSDLEDKKVQEFSDKF